MSYRVPVASKPLYTASEFGSNTQSIGKYGGNYDFLKIVQAQRARNSANGINVTSLLPENALIKFTNASTIFEPITEAQIVANGIQEGAPLFPIDTPIGTLITCGLNSATTFFQPGLDSYVLSANSSDPTGLTWVPNGSGGGGVVPPTPNTTLERNGTGAGFLAGLITSGDITVSTNNTYSLGVSGTEFLRIATANYVTAGSSMIFTYAGGSVTFGATGVSSPNGLISNTLNTFGSTFTMSIAGASAYSLTASTLELITPNTLQFDGAFLSISGLVASVPTEIIRITPGSTGIVAINGNNYLQLTTTGIIIGTYGTSGSWLFNVTGSGSNSVLNFSAWNGSSYISKGTITQ